MFSKSGCLDVWGGERLVDERTDGCETVKGGFFASFHMETLVFRLLESSERSECGCSRSLSHVLYLYSRINCLTLPYI